MKSFIKIGLSLALLAVLIYRLDWSGVLVALAKADWWVLAAAIGLQLAAYAVGAWRWSILLALHRLGHRLGNLVQIYLIGALFNNLLPSSAGGDLLRAYHIYRQRHGLAVAVSPIITERVLGLVTLIGTAAIAVLFVTADNPLAGIFSTLLPMLLVGAVLILTLLASGGVYWPLHRFFERWRDVRLVAAVLRIAESSHRYLNQPRVVLRVVALSILMQGIEVVVFWLLGRGVGAETELLSYVVVVPLIFVASALPITIGGLGVRETAAIALFGLYGMAQDPAAAVMVLFLLVLIATSLPGLYFFLHMKEHKAFFEQASRTTELPH